MWRTHAAQAPPPPAAYDTQSAPPHRAASAAPREPRPTSCGNRTRSRTCMHDADVPSRRDPSPFADGTVPAPAPVAAPAPVPVIPLALDYADATGRRRRLWLRAGRYAAAFAWLLCAAAWVLLRFVDVETVLVTGPALFLVGTAALTAGLAARRRLLASLGAAHCAVCVLFVALVRLRTWGPDDARDPFTWMGAAYMLAVLAPTVRVLAEARPAS